MIIGTHLVNFDRYKNDIYFGKREVLLCSGYGYVCAKIVDTEAKGPRPIYQSEFVKKRMIIGTHLVNFDRYKNDIYFGKREVLLCSGYGYVCAKIVDTLAA